MKKQRANLTHGTSAVIDYLREEGLIGSCDMNGLAAETDDVDPVDATMVPLSFPAPRSLRLQVLARGMTQAVEALAMRRSADLVLRIRP